MNRPGKLPSLSKNSLPVVLIALSSGQPPQRPQTLGPNPALAGPFRGGPYPSYGLPPRNVGVLPGGPTSYVPALQQPANQRTSQAQGMIPQATPTSAFLPRSQSGFYGTGMGAQHQQPTGLQQQQLPQSSQPPQPNGTPTSNPLTSHLPPPLNLAGNGAPSAPSKSEVALDLSDFPALGSVSSNIPNSGGSNGGGQVTTSYASQAGTGIPLSRGAGESATGSTASANNLSSQAREFTSDDFPALGNHAQSQLSTQDHTHPPGLNGFQHNSEHRQNLLGALGGTNTPGMLHLGGQQSRGVHPGFGQVLSDPEKVQQRVCITSIQYRSSSLT
jgi:CCR4-NOT transcription complex subunit 2